MHRRNSTITARSFGFVAALASLAALLPTSGSAHAIVIYVDDDAAPAGDGLSWNAPFRYLQDALTFANVWSNDVTDIHIAQGIYKPDQSEASPGGTGNRNAFFEMYFNVSGGYAGVGAIDPEARDIDAYETVLSGDLNGDDLPGFVNYDDNSFRLILSPGTIDGCTIRSAMQAIQGDAPATLTHCRVWFNSVVALIETGITATWCEFDHNGLGIKGTEIHLHLEHCTFTNNSGRCIWVAETYMLVADCTFHNNTDTACLVGEAGCLFRNCEFSGNTSAKGAAIVIGGGVTGSATKLVQCRFADNSADKGGAIYISGVSIGSTDVRFINCEFFQNTASVLGGAIFSKYAAIKLTNCTLVRNDAPTGGGIYNTSSSHAFVYNSILRGNAGGSLAGGLSTVRYSCISGGYPGEGNTDKNALFVDIDNGDLRLTAASNCIDAGSSTYLPGSIVTDIAGLPRYRDDPATPDTGSGSLPILDMGAHEFQPN